MTIEKLSNDVQQIKDDLNKLRESVSSEEEKEKMMKEILDKANATKRELEKEIETFNDEKKEKAQALLDSLNEIINFELSLTMPQGQNNEE
jgi:phage terminase small subunit